MQHGGRLAEWKGPGTNWTIVSCTAFVEVTGRRNFGKVIYALGWDAASVILKVFDGDNPSMCMCVCLCLCLCLCVCE